jgi:hypothetical protein
MLRGDGSNLIEESQTDRELMHELILIPIIGKGENA